MSQARQLLTARELAEELRVSERHARALIARGAVKSILIGRCRRIRRDELERVMREGTSAEAALQ
jgi:excisionase family DNA binding protein